MALVALVGAVLAGGGVGLAGTDAGASAYPNGTVTLEGHGDGHGHGMGQWGALGYALAHTGYRPILAHYYGGSSLSALSSQQEATKVRVAITENDGNTVIVTSGSAFNVSGASLDVPGGDAMLISPTAGGRWSVRVGPSCAGPWPAQPIRTNLSDPTINPAHDPALGDPSAGSKALQLCQGGGNLTVRGSIEALYNSDGAARTVNVVPLEQYVSGVVPNESPAGWGTLGGSGAQGQAWGFQELEAQAVAARSYVMAGLGSWGGYADTCDLDCQTYRGTLNENSLTDLAVSDTAGQVMKFPGGAVAATQYSASTGGYTNPGAFPAVPDTGDSVCVPGACNPSHTWTVTVRVSTIEADWPALGTLESIDVTGRNGDGDWGGRVTAMTLVGSRGRVSLSGDQFAGELGLQSDWFTTNPTSGGSTLKGGTTPAPEPVVAIAAARSGAGYLLANAGGGVAPFGDAGFYGSMGTTTLNKPIVGAAMTSDGKGYWLVASDGVIFAFGDAAFYGSTGSMVLNKPIVGIARTKGGKGYWLVASDGGIFAFGDAGFYGSTGSMVLNRPVVGMAATPDGKGYWLVASDGGIFAFGDAAFYGSTGSMVLNKPVVAMASTPDGKGYWLVASDGGIFAFGDAAFYGSTGSIVLNEPIVAAATTPDGKGYWLVASDGGVFCFGDAKFYGSGAS
jgi:SpoIID/LytB domain protein